MRLSGLNWDVKLYRVEMGLELRASTRVGTIFHDADRASGVVSVEIASFSEHFSCIVVSSNRDELTTPVDH